MEHHPFSSTEAEMDAHDFHLLDYATTAAMFTEDFERAMKMDFDTLEQITIDFLLDISAPPYSIWSIERESVLFDEEFWRASPYLMLRSPGGNFVTEGVSTATLKLLKTLYYDQKFPSNITELLRLANLTKKFGIERLVVLFTEFFNRTWVLHGGKQIRIFDSPSAPELEKSTFRELWPELLALRRNRNRSFEESPPQRALRKNLGKRKSPTNSVDSGMESVSHVSSELTVSEAF